MVTWEMGNIKSGHSGRKERREPWKRERGSGREGEGERTDGCDASLTCEGEKRGGVPTVRASTVERSSHTDHQRKGTTALMHALEGRKDRSSLCSSLSLSLSLPLPLLPASHAAGDVRRATTYAWKTRGDLRDPPNHIALSLSLRVPPLPSPSPSTNTTPLCKPSFLARHRAFRPFLSCPSPGLLLPVGGEWATQCSTVACNKLQTGFNSIIQASHRTQLALQQNTHARSV
jgi:hypothetical protein